MEVLFTSSMLDLLAMILLLIIAVQQLDVVVQSSSITHSKQLIMETSLDATLANAQLKLVVAFSYFQVI